MKYRVKFSNASGECRTLSVEAEDYNEAVKKAKRNCRSGERIAKITWIASSIFEDLTKMIQANPILR